MIWQDIVKLKIQKDDYKDEINTVCYNKFCLEFRLSCLKCTKQGIHHAYFNEVEKVSDLKNKEQIDEDLETQIQDMKQSFSYLKMGIKSNIHIEKKISSFEFVKNNDKQIQLLSQGYKLLDQYYQILILYNENKYQQAIEIFNKSISLDPNYYQAVKVHVMKYEEAINWLDQALTIDSKDLFSLKEKGACLRLLSKYKEAISWFDKALAINLEDIFQQVKKFMSNTVKYI